WFAAAAVHAATHLPAAQPSFAGHIVKTLPFWSITLCRSALQPSVCGGAVPSPKLMMELSMPPPPESAPTIVPPSSPPPASLAKPLPPFVVPPHATEPRTTRVVNKRRREGV